MKYTFDQIRERLSCKDKKARVKYFHELLEQNEPSILVYLLNLLKQVKIPNGRRLIIQEMGNSRNPMYIDALLSIAAYDQIDRSLILDALIKIGAFNKYFGNKTPGLAIREKLYLLNQFYASKYIIKLLSSKDDDFERIVKRALSATSHWRK